jgi:antitoxin component YwqK of YwqJK toxin-antitoxin module
MKNLIFILVCVISSQTCFSQNRIDSAGMKQGVWIINYPYDTLLGEVNCLRICSYKNDTIDGKFMIYNNKNTLRYQGLYVKGNPYGMEYFYTQKGKLLRTQQHVNDTVYIVTDYWGRAKPYRMATYTNQVLNGAHIYYRRSGKIKIISYYENDIEVGSSFYFRRNGKLRHSRVK